MIIDARNTVSRAYGRPGTAKAAIGHALDGIEVGHHIHVEAMKNSLGAPVPWERLSMYVNAIKGDRTFKVRKSIHADGYEIHRVA